MHQLYAQDAAMENEFDLSFYKDKKVLITGHTGFKGSWMCKMLKILGAEVYGYALNPPTDPSLFHIAGISQNVESCIGDIRDPESLKNFVQKTAPEIVIHMAAQPIVRDSYDDPVYTYETNVMGTVHILEAVREAGSVKSFLNVTTDKVYLNNEWCWPYREDDKLDGYDPYSNSKSCSEIVTHSYRKCFLKPAGVAVSTARAGNVIGGGDFASFRIVPDCVRAIQDSAEMTIRNPDSIRPYQHVMEPVYAYLMICARQYADEALSGEYNVGPNDTDCVTTKDLVDKFNCFYNNELKVIIKPDNGPREAHYLKLDCSKLKSVFGWKPRWSIDNALEKTADWVRAWLGGADMSQYTESQIREFLRI